jgi:pimeloyl-ACP methyl ester carboxylesterase
MPSPEDPSSEIHLSTPNSPTNRPYRTYIIYFITGNPGLIEYYRPFLTHLYGLLTSSSSSPPHTPTIHVFGRSLSGFETTSSPQVSRSYGSGPPYGLQDQIARSEEALEQFVQGVRQDEGTDDVRVVLMGHSVGSYMLFEIIRRQREKTDGLRIVGGMCLFPTITDLAKSPSGRKSSVRPPSTPTRTKTNPVPKWLITLPHVPQLIAIIATPLTLLPASVLTRLIQTLLSFPSAGAAVTAAFLKSPHGIHSALHMARDEMLQMTSDKWTDEIWGAAHASSHAHPRPILRFLYAKEDHWIANETRDEVVRTRGVRVDARGERIGGGEGEADSLLEGGEEWKPRMEIDEVEGWVHGFCIRDSVPVAERVAGYVKDVLEKDGGR